MKKKAITNVTHYKGLSTGNSGVRETSETDYHLYMTALTMSSYFEMTFIIRKINVKL